MLATLRELPQKGSLRESVLILLHLKQEEINHARIRALAQTIINKEKGPEVFEEYMRLAFPWVETAKKRDRSEQIKLLQQEVSRGALGIKPLWEKPVRSRLKAKTMNVVQKTETERNQFYGKLGMVVPLK